MPKNAVIGGDYLPGPPSQAHQLELARKFGPLTWASSYVVVEVIGDFDGDVSP